MEDNNRSFRPFNLDASDDQLFTSIDGFEPKKAGILSKLAGRNLNGFGAIDNAVADVSNELHKKLPMYDYFMDVHWQAIQKVLKNKFGI